MPLFLDTRGRGTLGIGICGRCSQKMSLEDLFPDPNAPGLRVCRDDLDMLDPWRLPPRPADNITLRFPRPDVQLFPFGPTPVYPQPIEGISQIQPTNPWLPNTYYAEGASVSPLNGNSPAVNGPQYEYVASVSGTSGLLPPAWPQGTGTTVVDGTVTWFCVGLFLLDGATQQQQLLPTAPSLPPPTPKIVVPNPPLYAGTLVDDGNLVGIIDPIGWATSPGAPGTWWVNSGVIMAVSGGVQTSNQPVYFNGLSAAELLLIPTANLPTSPGGTGTLWINSGVLWIS